MQNIENNIEINPKYCGYIPISIRVLNISCGPILEL